MKRVAVVGNSGSGKSALAARLARQLGVSHIELDALFHLPNWQELPEDDFRAQVSAAIVADGWVVDGNYRAVRELIWDRADTVVWLDLPRRLVMLRIIWRTLSRMVLRRQLWNGNRERVSNLLSTDPAKSIILWSWTKHSEYRRRYAAAMSDGRWAHVQFVRIASPRAAEGLLRSVASSAVADVSPRGQAH